MGVFLVQTDGVCTEVWVFGLFAALKVSLMQYFGFACPKIGGKGTAHRRTAGKAAPRGIYAINSGGTRGARNRGFPPLFTPPFRLLTAIGKV